MAGRKPIKKNVKKDYKIAVANMKFKVYNTIKRIAHEEQRTIGNQAEVMLEKYIDEHNLW